MCKKFTERYIFLFFKLNNYIYKRRDAPRGNVPSANYVRSIEFLRRYSASVSFAAKRTLLISESSCIFDEYPPDILSSAAFTVGW